MAENHRALLREWNLPRWSAGYWGERTAGALAALPADLAAEAAAIAARGSMFYDAHPRPPSVPDETPAGAVAALGSDSGMPLGTTPDALARLTTALRARWSLATGGPRAWLESELARMGYSTTLSFVDDYSAIGASVLAGSVARSAGGTVTIAWPAHIAGDAGILFLTDFAISAVPSISGWTALGSIANGAASIRLCAYSRIAASGAEASVVIPADGNYRAAAIVRSRNSTLVEHVGSMTNSGSTVTIASAPLLRRGRTTLAAYATRNNGAIWSGYVGVESLAQIFSDTGLGNGWAIARAESTRALVANASAQAVASAVTGDPVGLAIVLRGRAAPDSQGAAWDRTRFWVEFPEGQHQALGSAAVVGSAVIGTDSIGPFTQPEWALWFRQLVATVERCRPAEWVCWDYEFVVPDGTIRIMGHYRFQDSDYVYFTAA